MSWTIDQASILTAEGAASSLTLGFTTGVDVAPGGLISVAVSGDGANCSSISCGGLLWTKDNEGTSGLTGSLWRAYAPSGLASLTAGTITWASAVTNRAAVGSSILGGDGTLDQTVAAAIGGTGAPVGWATNSITPTADAITIAAAFSWSASATDTPAAGSTEITEFTSAGGVSDKSLVLLYRTDSGAHTIAGTWATTGNWVALVNTYTAGVVGSPPIKDPDFTKFSKVIMR